MEILVATAIFAGTLTMMMVLLNFTLKINRRVEALRQVSQATRNFTEFLVREVRNGQIDYSGAIDPINCPPASPQYNGTTNQTLALVNRNGDRQCFFLSDINTGVTPNTANLKVTKRTVTGTTVTEQINPPNVTIEPNSFRFFVRPATDPNVSVAGTYPGAQPFVTLVMNVNVRLNSREGVTTIPYQTTVSTDAYGIPHR
jgi:type II secretory pathway pseudopilin PulG